MAQTPVVVKETVQTMNLVCSACRRTFDIHDPRWQCVCGGLLDISDATSFSPRSLPATTSLWRYSSVLPLSRGDSTVAMCEGFTPLVQETLYGARAHLKLDYLFPSGSYKDRGAAVLVSKMLELGIAEAVEDSSGNAGAAIAAYCARAGIRCSVYVPERTSPDKTTQIRAYGAEVVRVPGSREDTAAAVKAAATNAYYASHSWNPFFFEGTKTFGYEVCEHLGWQAPDAIVLPCGNGTLLLGVHKALRELHAMGVIPNVSRLIAIQSEACASIHHARQGTAPASGRTIAEGIAVAAPVRKTQILDAIRETNGCTVTVTDAQIEEALQALFRRGYYVEPTAAAAVAGLGECLRLEYVRPDETLVVPLTGSGLKASAKIAALVGSE